MAFDYIMRFDGRFGDQIHSEKLDVINISFLAHRLEKKRGGCGGNIAYTLALLGLRPRLVASVGEDCQEYRDALERVGVDLAAVAVHKDEMTATAFVITDRGESQITGFHAGAMQRARELSVIELAGADPVLCIIAPDDPEAIIRHSLEARQAGIPRIFDPSFQVTAMDGESLIEAARGAKVLMLNEYELGVFQEKTHCNSEQLFELVEIVVVTMGLNGSRICRASGRQIHVLAAATESVVDPTGAGDAYRGGFVAGWMSGYDLRTCGQMGSVAGVFAVESYGPQGHRFTREDFERRYEVNYGDMLGQDVRDD